MLHFSAVNEIRLVATFSWILAHLGQINVEGLNVQALAAGQVLRSLIF